MSYAAAGSPMEPDNVPAASLGGLFTRLAYILDENQERVNVHLRTNQENLAIAIQLGFYQDRNVSGIGSNSPAPANSAVPNTLEMFHALLDRLEQQLSGVSEAERLASFLQNALANQLTPVQQKRNADQSQTKTGSGN